MFADPISLTFNAVAQAMPRVRSSSGSSTSQFRTADGLYSVEIGHRPGARGRTRSLFKLTQVKIGPDPFAPTTNVQNSVSLQFVIDSPDTGFTDAEIGYLVTGFCQYMVAGGNQTKFLGGES